MTAQLALNLPAIHALRRRARQIGQERAEEAAERAQWRTEAYTYLCQFARQHHVFTGEDVSDAHIAEGRPQPSDLRHWGGLYRLAVSERVIRRIDNNGWSTRRSSPCPRYESLVYRGLA
jgi:hypothetical protein